ncbi:OLC1v1034811C2 [Oldenlandia corymbosa var. corymbosa]|uniref:OLC1v1034811C2 n=1 Tax=Oldenlandia corymbosa var. corymbosa TaxID=529605 RepID=A0AAV1CUL0_OLDCO|nr:OLC1v1034811C2 [Oldenlandia corymbosa var. corymbosa]
MAAVKRDGDDGGPDDDGELRLIAMRKDDSSWQFCRISLCSDRVGLNVEYMKDGSGDVIMTKEEALARLRLCSPPLQLEQCTLIGQGERVLANPKSQAKDVFFEADVEKRMNVRHTRKQCRCTFVVRWDHQMRDGETAVLPLPAIVKMLTTCIDVHPTIAAFFNILANPGCNLSPVSTLHEGTKDGEMDVFKLESDASNCEMDALELEKQIECISKSAAASEMESSEKLVFGVQADKKSQAQDNSPTTHSSIFRSHFFSRMEEKIQQNAPTPPLKDPIIKEDSVKRRTSYNPQASIAYFASEKLKISGSPEGSSTLKGAEAFKSKPGVYVNSKGGTPYNVSLFGNSSNAEDHHIRKKAALDKSVLKNKSIVKKLFSIDEASKDHRILDELSVASDREQSKKMHSQPEMVNDISHATNEKMKKPSRSARKISPKISGDNGEITCITKAKLVPSSVNTRRLTRSAVRKMEENNINKEKPSSNRDTDLLQDEGTVVCTSKEETASTLTTKRKRQEENGVTNHEKERETTTHFVEIKEPNNLRRLTRSAAHRQTENSDMEPRKKLEATESSSAVEGNIRLESRASEREAPISLCSPTAGRCNKVQRLASVKVVLSIEGKQFH